jgi:hypothetical protein
MFLETDWVKDQTLIESLCPKNLERVSDTRYSCFSCSASTVWVILSPSLSSGLHMISWSRVLDAMHCVPVVLDVHSFIPVVFPDCVVALEFLEYLLDLDARVRGARGRPEFPYDLNHGRVRPVPLIATHVGQQFGRGFRLSSLYMSIARLLNPNPPKVPLYITASICLVGRAQGFIPGRIGSGQLADVSIRYLLNHTLMQTSKFLPP